MNEMRQDTQAGAAGNVERFLTLTLDKELFAIDIYSVREILDMADITRIPHTPEYMRGVVNVRGTAVPVIDLKRKFSMGDITPTLNTRIVILEIKKADEISLIGAMADSVREVLELEMDKVDPPPSMGVSVKSEFIRGIGKHGEQFVLLLDASKVFSSEEVINLSQAQQQFAEAQAVESAEAVV